MLLLLHEWDGMKDSCCWGMIIVGKRSWELEGTGQEVSSQWFRRVHQENCWEIFPAVADNLTGYILTVERWARNEHTCAPTHAHTPHGGLQQACALSLGAEQDGFCHKELGYNALVSGTDITGIQNTPRLRINLGISQAGAPQHLVDANTNPLWRNKLHFGSQQIPTDKIPKTMKEQLHNQNPHTIQQDTVTKNKTSTRWKQKE